MKTLLFDAGPVISLTTNNLLWLLEKLKKSFNGEFYITEKVKAELIEKPLNTKKFKFEALQVKRLLDTAVIRVYKEESIAGRVDELFSLANRIYSINDRSINIVHHAEMEVLAAAVALDSQAIVIDERTTRLLLENPGRLENILKNKFRMKIQVNKGNLKRFRELVKGIKVIRSVELVTVAFEKGLLDDYLTDLPHARKTLIESVLWGVKLHGCSVSHVEIDKIVTLETRR
jgi:hypothetical protein